MLPLLLMLSLSNVASANHPNAEIDLCKIYQDKLPPGLTLEALPEPTSQGALILNQYCTQCHNLPGPDRHTATEWGDVTQKMFMLSEVSNRFGGWPSHVKKISTEEQATLLAYLQRHAATEVFTLPLWFTRFLALLPVLLLVGFGVSHGYRSLRGSR